MAIHKGDLGVNDRWSEILESGLGDEIAADS
jgi:hypothetical protein